MRRPHPPGERRLSRRALCRAVTGAVVLSATAPLVAKPEPRFRLRYILASSLYGKMPLEVILPEVQRTGSEHIDLWPEVHANQREQMEAMGHERFAALLEKHGVRLGMTTRYDLGPLRLEAEMEVLKRFGARLVVTGSRGGKEVSGSQAKEAVRAFVQEMAPQVAAAERLGVTIGIENHAHALVATVDSIRYLAEA
ncbi:MAG: TIM barrel protein, partial [Thermoguttaceae bacterium]|nr:TIM barrel protein [Thermoguttaceae bacterium]